MYIYIICVYIHIYMYIYIYIYIYIHIGFGAEADQRRTMTGRLLEHACMKESPIYILFISILSYLIYIYIYILFLVFSSLSIYLSVCLSIFLRESRAAVSRSDPTKLAPPGPLTPASDSRVPLPSSLRIAISF